MKWTDKEAGPTCFCGMPTMVTMSEDRVDLLCIFHDKEAGAMFPLPKDGRPDKWPNMTDEEMDQLVTAGEAEQDALEEE